MLEKVIRPCRYRSTLSFEIIQKRESTLITRFLMFTCISSSSSEKKYVRFDFNIQVTSTLICKGSRRIGRLTSGRKQSNHKYYASCGYIANKLWRDILHNVSLS